LTIAAVTPTTQLSWRDNRDITLQKMPFGGQ
jgi:hypothetical protein